MSSDLVLGHFEVSPRLNSPSLNELFKYRDFVRYASARFLATIAWQMLGVAVGWQVYALAGNPLDLGLVGLAQFLPFLLLVLPAGQLADRVDRRWVLLGAYSAEALAVLALLYLTATGLTSVWPVFVALGLFGAGRAFWMPSGQAMVINLVPSEIFPRAVGCNSTLFQSAVIAGPALGGVIFALGERFWAGRGALLCYAVIFVLMLVVLLLLASIRQRQVIRAQGEWRWRDVFDGLRFVWRSKPVLGAISLDLFAVLLGGAVALLPVFAKDILHVGPAGLGLLRSAPGIGAALVAAWLALRPIERHVGRHMFGGVALFAVATIVFGLSTSFALSLTMLFLMGAGDMVSMFVRHLLVQLQTPDEIRGRVSAVNSMFIGASNELGEFESGLTAHWWGTVPAVVVGGLACLGVVFGCMALFPSLRKMDRFPAPNVSPRNLS
jgi:MFS family permease